MAKLPLLEALKYVALQAGLKVAVGENAVYIVPITYAIPVLTSAEYLTPPRLLGLSSDIRTRYPEEIDSVSDTVSSESVAFRRLDMKSWFESRGVSFPPGAESVYLLSTRKLVVHNTQENLDKIVSIISSALKPATPTPPCP